MPACLDDQWKIDVKKASAQPPTAVRERLRRIIERIGVPSKRTYTARGARLTENSRLPVWTRAQDKNRISYGIDAEHPMLSAFEARLDAEAVCKFKRILGLIASALPIDALHADVSASSGSVTLQPMATEDFEDIAKATWSVLRERGLSSVEAEMRMRSADPFRTHWDETVKVIRFAEMGGTEEP